MGICENENSGKLFKTAADMEKHTKYHCGAEVGNPFTSNNEEGGARRKTAYGFGIPKEDMFTIKGKVMVGENKGNVGMSNLRIWKK